MYPYQDDFAGRPIWNLEEATEDLEAQSNREDMIYQLEDEIERLRTSGDIELVEGMPLGDLGEGGVELGIQVIESLIEGVRSGEPGESVLLAFYKEKEKKLFGFSLNPESGSFENLEIILDNIPEQFAHLSGTVMKDVIELWSRQTNSVIAWKGTKILCSPIFDNL